MLFSMRFPTTGSCRYPFSITKITYIDFVVGAFARGRMRFIDASIAWAFLTVVVDNTACLEVRIDCDRAEVFEAALSQITADAVGESVADGYPPLRMAVVKDCLAV